jgi:hypothetical protein
MNGIGTAIQSITHFIRTVMEKPFVKFVMLHKSLSLMYASIILSSVAAIPGSLVAFMIHCVDYLLLWGMRTQIHRSATDGTTPSILMLMTIGLNAQMMGFTAAHIVVQLINVVILFLMWWSASNERKALETKAMDTTGKVSA